MAETPEQDNTGWAGTDAECRVFYDTCRLEANGRYEYIMARVQGYNKSVASLKTGHNDNWLYGLSPLLRTQLEDTATWMRKNFRAIDEQVLQDSLVESARVITEGLRSKNPEYRLKCAIELQDRVKGRPLARSENYNSNVQGLDADLIALIDKIYGGGGNGS